MPTKSELLGEFVGRVLQGTLVLTELLPLLEGASAGQALATPIVVALDEEIAGKMGLIGTRIDDVVKNQMESEATGIYEMTKSDEEKRRQEWEMLLQLAGGFVHIGAEPDPPQNPEYDVLTQGNPYLFRVPEHFFLQEEVTEEEADEARQNAYYRAIFFGDIPTPKNR